MQYQVFNYIQELDAFLVNPLFSDRATELGLSEWSPVVFLGRLFTLDNDFGEHWFDNWDEREERSEEAKRYGINDHDLFIVNPERFQDGRDGPCHSSDARKAFWTDVLKSFRISDDTLIQISKEKT